MDYLTVVDHGRGKITTWHIPEGSTGRGEKVQEVEFVPGEDVCLLSSTKPVVAEATVVLSATGEEMGDWPVVKELQA